MDTQPGSIWAKHVRVKGCNSYMYAVGSTLCTAKGLYVSKNAQNALY